MDFLLKSVLAVLLCILSIEDIKKREISNLGNISFLLLSMFYSIKAGTLITKIVISMGVYPLPLLFLYGYVSDFMGKEVLGFGDIKFVMGVGVFMSTDFLWFHFYYFYLFSFFLAAIGGILYFYFKKEREIPMIPAFCCSIVMTKILL